MARPFTRAQALQNAAFLRALRRTGNVRAACRALGVHRATYTKRRARDPAFAAEWDAALAVAHAALQVSPRAGFGEGDRRPKAGDGGADPHVIRTAAGRLQLRRARPGRLTRAAEQAFLAALGATANVRLAAAAAGFSHSAFYHRRKTSPAFAREMRMAIEMGYERLEMALIAGFDPASCRDDAWRSNDPPPIPSMTPDQALQQLWLHFRATQLWAEVPYMKRRRGETTAEWSHRRAADYLAERARQDDQRAVAAAARLAHGAPSPHEPPAPLLPALDQVMATLKTRPRPAAAPPIARPDLDAMLKRAATARAGGWRLGDREGDG